MIYYLFYRKTLLDSENKNIFLIHLFLLIGTAGGMFYGTNDSLFSVSLLMLACESYLYIRDRSHSFLLLVISMSICILSRPHWLLTVPIILVIIIIIDYSICKRLGKSIVNPINFSFIIAMIIAIIFNYPKIIEANYSHDQGNYLPKYLFLSYSDKSGTYKTNDPNFNWIQWHYYSQVHSNKRFLGLFAPMVNWEDVKKYKDAHGENSLPDSYLNYVLSYPKEVIKRVPVSIFETYLLSIRYVGLFLFIISFWIFDKVKEKRLNLNSIFIPLFTFLTIIVFAILLPRTLDSRWFIPQYITLLLMIVNNNNQLKSILNKNILILNVLIMDFITIWALWKWKIFLHI